VVLASDTAAALNLKIKILPLVLSDHNDWPVFWYRGRLIRCLPRGNKAVRDCHRGLTTWIADHQRDTLHLCHSTNSTYTQIEVIRDCSNMHWICRSAPRAALRASVRESNESASETSRAVQLRPQTGYGVVPDATLVSTMTPRNRATLDLLEAPMFHFRKWIDQGSWRTSTPGKLEGRPAFFIISNSGFIQGKSAHGPAPFNPEVWG